MRAPAKTPEGTPRLKGAGTNALRDPTGRLDFIASLVTISAWVWADQLLGLEDGVDVALAKAAPAHVWRSYETPT